MKAAQVGEQFKAALQNDAHMQVNEVCFVASDSAVAKSTMAAQLAARTLGFSPERTDQLFSDPEKLLQLIMAAEGTKRTGNTGANSGTGGDSERIRYRSAKFSGAGRPKLGDPICQPGSRFDRQERSGEQLGKHRRVRRSRIGQRRIRQLEHRRWKRRGRRRKRSTAWQQGARLGNAADRFDRAEIGRTGRDLQVLGQLGRAGDAPKGKLQAHAIKKQLADLPQNAEFTASQVLATLAAHAAGQAPDSEQLLKLAEHIAVRFALESYERGDTKVNAEQQTLSDMPRELDGLRKTPGGYEEKLTEAGFELQSENEVLAHKFWSQVTDEKKKSVLESSDAWCVPAAKVRECVEVLRLSGEATAAEKILRNYANCISSDNPEQRRHAATGLIELAPVYANAGEQLFLEVIRLAALQLAQASDPNLQSVVGAAFVRLVQEAANKRAYPIIQHASEMTSFIESENPGTANNLRARIGLELRVPDFIEGALKTGDVPAELAELLRRMPLAATEHIASRFGRVALIEDSESLLWMLDWKC
jgi:hypothetical protein